MGNKSIHLEVLTTRSYVMMDDFGLFCVIIFLSSVFVRKDWKKLNMYFVE